MGIRYLHKFRIIHRDLKLVNLFLSKKMEIKLGYFALATRVEFEGVRKRTICGTLIILLPRYLKGIMDTPTKLISGHWG
jgi:serine/threonine protein kinase